MIYKSNKKNRKRKTAQNKGQKVYFDRKSFPQPTDEEMEQLKQNIYVFNFCRANLGILEIESLY